MLREKWQTKFFSLYGSQNDARLVNANGIEYYIIITVVLPHEILHWLGQ